jgi:hypothetical protein
MGPLEFVERIDIQPAKNNVAKCQMFADKWTTPREPLLRATVKAYYCGSREIPRHKLSSFLQFDNVKEMEAHIDKFMNGEG